MSPSMSAEDALAAALLVVKKRSPYMYGTLIFLARTKVPGKGTIGVTYDGKLLYDPEAVISFASEKNGLSKLGTVLEHEFMHLVLRHDRRARKLNLETQEELERWNKAGDLSINPLLAEQGREFPSQPLMPENFGFEVGLTAEGYYSRLRDEDAKNKNKQAPGPCNGHCCSQHSGGSGDDSDDDQQAPGQPPPPSQPQVDQQIAEAGMSMRDAIKNRGNAAAGILRTLDELLAPPKVRWDEKLKRLVSFHGEHRPGQNRSTYTRPNKKQGGLGFGVGSPRLTSTFSSPTDVGIVLDTSGSMGKAEMESILPEACEIITQARGKVTFLACDAAVHSMEKVGSVQELLQHVKGGGGTDMKPAIQAVRGMHPSERPKILVLFTDGYVGDIGPEPEEFKTIWCCTTESTGDLTWGDVIRIND